MSKSKSTLVSTDFNPTIFSPFFFIRKGLLEAAILFSEYTKGGRLLDFGCGSKPYKKLFNVSEYIGLDFENPGHSHTNEQIDVIYEGKEIPFENEGFDYILCTEVVEHLFDPLDKFNEFHRVLKQGGKLFLTCPFVWNEHEVPYDFARYTRFALGEMLTKTGFKIIHYEKKGSFIETYFQLFYLYFSKPETGYKDKKISFLKKLVIGMVNRIAILLNKLLPGNSSLYLSNVAVAEKI